MIDHISMSDAKPTKSASRAGAQVLNTFIDALDWEAAVNTIVEWGRDRQPRTVCLCNVHSSITALDDPQLATALGQADMVLPDGAPVAWMLRRKGFPHQPRIAGPDLMLETCSELARTTTGVFLFGSTEQTLQKLDAALRTKFPALNIVGSLSPRFGAWTDDEKHQYAEAINQSGAGIIFVGLGCPKQEIWMAESKERIHGVLLGVGAAFDFHAGTIQRAPTAFQKLGLEWLHRLLSEPRRLWKRYFTTNTRFLALSCRELIKLNRK